MAQVPSNQARQVEQRTEKMENEKIFSHVLMEETK